MEKVTVLIVDDSALVRQLLAAILSRDPEIEVVGAAPDPLVARQMIKDLNPRVITLDVEMPRMDGIAFLEKIMRLRPMPVVMVSTLTQKGADTTLRALEIGAVDFVAKPTMDLQSGLEAMAAELVAKVKAAAQARVRPRSEQAISADRPPAPRMGVMSSDRLLAIGASTGGVEAITEVLRGMPADCPPIVITQHMPPQFTTSFARRLDTLAAPNVAEAVDGERLARGHVRVAPGGHHLEVLRDGAGWVCRIHEGAAVSGHRPSVDVLFSSVAQAAGAHGVGVILTGMGRDGAQGLLAMRQAGAHTVGQTEASCVVYGMPKAAFEVGGVEKQVALEKIAENVLALCRIGKTAG
ncbi:MAG: chemotaxis response regulator protein-glutamate methylesterase [Alphaproteobacteria bacterium]|nr:chemotaxis response regulator protein-glutamate methylesterase [Alphaproteobacteria bacterium]